MFGKSYVEELEVSARKLASATVAEQTTSGRLARPMLQPVDMTTPEQAISSGDARDAILSQHKVLRALLAVTVESAAETARSARGFETLRGHAKRLYDTLAEHMSFEEQFLSAAFRDVIGWGTVLQARIEEDHG
jgi:hypothetical protein